MDRIEKLKQFLDKSPADSFLQHALALEYIKIGEDEAARLLFMEILEREPSYTGSYYHLGKLLERIGRPEDAMHWYRKGMDESKRAGEHHAFGELRGALEELDMDAG